MNEAVGLRNIVEGGWKAQYLEENDTASILNLMTSWKLNIFGSALNYRRTLDLKESNEEIKS